MLNRWHLKFLDLVTNVTNVLPNFLDHITAFTLHLPMVREECEIEFQTRVEEEV